MTVNTNTISFKTLGKSKVIQGSILTPHNAGLRFVLNINNTKGKTDGAWYNIFDKKWKRVKEDAKGWYNTRTGAYKLGAINNTAVQSDTWVIHMLCQDDKLNTDLKGLEECLKHVCKLATYERATVHISSALTKVIPELTQLVNEQLVNNGVNVFFYQEE